MAGIALLHDESLFALPAGKANAQRMRRINNFRGYQALERELQRVARELNEQCSKNNKEAVDLIQLMDEIDAAKKLVQRTNDKLQMMHVEQDAPPRITWPSTEPLLSTADASKRKIMTGAAVVLAGLGILLLGLAGIKFRAHKAHAHVEHSSIDSSTE